MSYLDFIIQEFANYVENIYPEEYGKYGFLEKIKTNFENLEKIKKYYEREDAIKGPFIAGKANLMF